VKERVTFDMTPKCEEEEEEEEENRKRNLS